MRHPPRAASAAVVAVTVVLALWSGTAAAQTGVGDDRVSLPDGPGSLDGIGDNAGVDANMGLMSTSVPFEVPAGFDGVTPALALTYSSGAGSSVVGIGWSLPVSSIERMTSQGLPGYVDDDRFVADGSTQLVRVSLGEPAVYRARFEGGFVRYGWHEHASGDEGYWVAEHPDGSVAYFGADRAGVAVESARVRSPAGVFRYLLVEKVDRFGHRVRYDYRVYGTVPLLDQVGWVFTDGALPRHVVSFDYEPRDDVVSDARGGFNEALAHRLAAVDVLSGGERVRRYALTYEPYAAAGGMSRLARVEGFGHDGTPDPATRAYAYSRSLGGVCDGVECASPYLVRMGSLGIDLSTRTANLVDLNGDALPDVVSTAAGGAMRVFLNELHGDGSQDFAAPFASAVGVASSFPLEAGAVQLLDVDGDGFTDVLNAATGQVLVNKGAGDWDSVQTLTGGGTTALPADAFTLDADADLSNIRFFDHDGDHKIDVLRSVGATTEIFRSQGDLGFAAVAGVDAIGVGFADERRLELADMNGDGLLDPTIVRAGQVTYRLNLGRGRWSEFLVIDDLPFSGTDLDLVQLEDVNGDGLDDVVVVAGASVRYALNRSGATFDQVQTITQVQSGAVPDRGTSSVLFADMNGNGSNDVVWIDNSGDVTFLELFPVRPNLLTRVVNGLGLVTEVTYATAAEYRARATDPAAWPHPVPMQMVVVASVDTYAQGVGAADALHDVVSYLYAGGFYDGVEKQFRGHAHVEQTRAGDPGSEGARVVQTWDTGAGVDRAHMAGFKLTEDVLSAAGPLVSQAFTYGLCDVAGVPTAGLVPPVRRVCRTGQSTTLQQGAAPTEWATLEESYEHDGYGNTTRSVGLGVTAIGGAGCAPCARAAGVFGEPCGDTCTGDEAYEESEYVDVTTLGGRWLLGLRSVERRYGRPGSDQLTEVQTFYDGAPFVGLPLGQATLGLPSRVARRRDVGGPFDELARQRFDEHGNAVEGLAQGRSVDDEAGRQLRTYDADHLDVVRQERTVDGPEGVRRLRQDYAYDPLFGGVTRVTDWTLVGEEPDPLSDTLLGYDELGRPAWKVLPGGDTPEAPSEVYAYAPGDPISRVTVARRAAVGGPLALEEVRCLDGFGRTLQRRTKVAEGRYRVDGAARFDRQGRARRVFGAFEAPTSACDAPGAAVPFDEMTYDASGQELRVVRPDGALYGTASVLERRFGPLSVTTLDEDDTDPASARRGTPVVVHNDGLGRVVRVERVEVSGAPPQVWRITYDELGNLRGFVDPAGDEKVQEFDLAGAVKRVTDPSRGVTTFTYDGAGNLARSTDARGVSTDRAYDALDRAVAIWDPADEEGTRAELYYDRHPVCAAATCTHGAGRIVGVKYPLGALGEGVESMGYDARGRMALRQKRLGGHAFEFTTTFDDADRVVTQTFPGGQRITYEVDLADRVTAIPGFIDRVDYDPRGMAAVAHYPNGTTTTWGYDVLERLDRVVTAGAGGDPRVSLEVERDRRNDVTAVRDGAEGPAGPSSSATFTYDALRRLVRAELDPRVEAHRDVVAYAYSPIDALLEKSSSRGADSPEHVGTLGYDPLRPKAVLTAGAATMEYDPAGGVVTRGGLGFGYDFARRLTTVDRGDDAVARYYFSVFDERIAAVQGGGTTWNLAPSFQVRDGITRLLLGVGQAFSVEVESDALAAELLPDLAPAGGDGRITGADAFAASGDDVRALLRSSARRMLLDDDGRHTAFVTRDHLGSTVAVLDDTGQVRERLRYTPYGAVRDLTAVRTEYASFTGKAYDRDTGLLHFGARSLMPQEGRWMSPDPTFEVFQPEQIPALVEAASDYAYVGGDPTTAVDADGRLSVLDVATFFFAGVGGVAVAFTTFGIMNIIGGVAGAIVGVTASVAASLADKAWASQSTSEKATTVLKAVGAGAWGFFTGFVSGGMTVLLDVAKGVAKYVSRKLAAQTKDKASSTLVKKVADAASTLAIIATAVFSPFDFFGAVAVGMFEQVKTGVKVLLVIAHYVMNHTEWGRATTKRVKSWFSTPKPVFDDGSEDDAGIASDFTLERRHSLRRLSSILRRPSVAKK